MASPTTEFTVEVVPDYWEMDRSTWLAFGKFRKGVAKDSFEIEMDVQQDLDHEARLTVRRTLWWSNYLAHEDEYSTDINSYDEDHVDEVRQRAIASEANLIASLTTNGKHAPTLDIDFGARLWPSRTAGHYHLYLDREMPWWRYRILLRVLAWAGIIEKGYYKASVKRRKTMLRWDVGQWEAEDGDTDLLVAQLLQIKDRTATVRTTEPKETS